MGKLGPRSPLNLIFQLPSLLPAGAGWMSGAQGNTADKDAQVRNLRAAQAQPCHLEALTS